MKQAKWEKLGRLISPQKNLWWMQTHAMVPTIDPISNNLYRIFFSGRDCENKSHIGYAIVDMAHTPKVLEYSKKPVLTVGELSCFDDNGVTPSCMVNHAGKKYLYYIGWNKKSRVRMSLFFGLAISQNGLVNFKRFSRAPLFERTNLEPYNILTGPCVIIEKGMWKMWYVSCVGWVDENLPRYHIKYAESKDGFSWDRKGLICVDFKSPDECALARPWVMKTGGRYEMWYSYKNKTTNYKIGYAESKDGLHWKRKDDEAGIGVSKSGWDSEMIEYANIFNHHGRKYMLYNGNDYGKSGIGLAVGW